MDSELSSYKNFRLVHQLKRRVRIISPVLNKDLERCFILEILLKKRPQIKRIRSVFSLGSVTIEFDPSELPKKNLLILLDAVLGNIAQKEREIREKKKRQFEGTVQEVDLAVQGMSCASCALLIEMVLNRDSQIKSASVNFATETVTVHGLLNKQQVSDKIVSLGYEPMSMDTLSQRKNLILKEEQRILAAKRRFLWSAVLSTPVIVIAMSMNKSRLSHWIQFILTTPVVLVQGNSFLLKPGVWLNKNQLTWIP